MTIASIRQPLPTRRATRRRRGGSKELTWHEPKDVDLAVWVTEVDNLGELRKARSRAVAELFARMGLGVAHHQVDVFILDAGSNEYRGCLCIFGQCDGRCSFQWARVVRPTPRGAGLRVRRRRRPVLDERPRF
jgi:hypothetical protein